MSQVSQPIFPHLQLASMPMSQVSHLSQLSYHIARFSSRYLVIRPRVNVQGDEKRGALTLTKESCSMVLYSSKDLALSYDDKK